MIKYTTGWEFDGREPPLIWEMYGYNFLGPPHRMCFETFFDAMVYWEEVPYIFHVIMYTIE